MKAWWKWSRKR